MAVPTIVEEPILALGYKYIIQQYAYNTDALDVYGMIRSFSTMYLTSLVQASTLLNFAGNVTEDVSTLELAKKVDGFVEQWDNYLEASNDGLIKSAHSIWARAILTGSPDENHLGWNVSFTMGDGFLLGNYVQCNEYIVFGGLPQSTISMRRSDNSWTIATVNPDTSQPDCVIARYGDTNFMKAVANPSQPAYLWSVHVPVVSTFPGRMRFSVRGYATHEDRKRNRNLLTWLGGWKDGIEFPILAFDPAGPNSEKDLFEFSNPKFH